MGRIKDTQKESVFNSSFTYLDRMNAWIERAHLFSADDDDIIDAFMALEELSIEILPLLSDDEVKILENLRLTTKTKLLLMQRDGKGLQQTREVFRVYQFELLKIIQDKGLLLKREDTYDLHADEEI